MQTEKQIKNENPERQMGDQFGTKDTYRWVFKNSLSQCASTNTANLMHKFSQRKLKCPDSLKGPSSSSILEQCYSTFNAEPGRKISKNQLFPTIILINHCGSCLRDHEINSLPYFILLCIIFFKKPESNPDGIKSIQFVAGQQHRILYL